MASSASMAAVDLYWLPLGAGGHSVRLNGLGFEALAARLQHRDRSDLYHSALEVRLPEARFVIEQAPAWNEAAERGVVVEGPVGMRALGRFRLFRYEIRRWREGIIPDVAEAVASPLRLTAPKLAFETRRAASMPLSRGSRRRGTRTRSAGHTHSRLLTMRGRPAMDLRTRSPGGRYRCST